MTKITQPDSVPAHTLVRWQIAVPFNDSLAERLLELMVRVRRNSGFFKVSIEAKVDDVLASVLAMCHKNGTNASAPCARWKAMRTWYGGCRIQTSSLRPVTRDGWKLTTETQRPTLAPALACEQRLSR